LLWRSALAARALGFGLSQQKHLPIQYTDFIFAVFAEFGFTGGLLAVAAVLIYATHWR